MSSHPLGERQIAESAEATRVLAVGVVAAKKQKKHTERQSTKTTGSVLS